MFGKVFFRQSISACWKLVLSKLLISSASKLLNQSRKRFDQSSSSPTSSHVSDTSDHPFFGVADAKVQQLFETTKSSEKFFFFESLNPCVWYLLYIGVPIIYIGVPRSHSRRHLLYIGVLQSHSRGYLLLYIVSVRTWDLDKIADKQLSNRQNLLTTQGSPDTSEDPFFWVASAKVIQLPESTKLSTNFFRRISGHPLRRKLILTWKSEGSEQIGVLVPLVTLANSQRLTANFLGLGKFNAGLLQ